MGKPPFCSNGTDTLSSKPVVVTWLMATRPAPVIDVASIHLTAAPTIVILLIWRMPSTTSSPNKMAPPAHPPAATTNPLSTVSMLETETMLPSATLSEPPAPAGAANSGYSMKPALACMLCAATVVLRTDIALPLPEIVTGELIRTTERLPPKSKALAQTVVSETERELLSEMEMPLDAEMILAAQPPATLVLAVVRVVTETDIVLVSEIVTGKAARNPVKRQSFPTLDL